VRLAAMGNTSGCRPNGYCEVADSTEPAAVHALSPRPVALGLEGDDQRTEWVDLTKCGALAFCQQTSTSFRGTAFEFHAQSPGNSHDDAGLDAHAPTVVKFAAKQWTGQPGRGCASRAWPNPATRCCLDTPGEEVLHKSAGPATNSRASSRPDFIARANSVEDLELAELEDSIHEEVAALEPEAWVLGTQDLRSGEPVLPLKEEEVSDKPPHSKQELEHEEEAHEEARQPEEEPGAGPEPEASKDLLEDGYEQFGAVTLEAACADGISLEPQSSQGGVLPKLFHISDALEQCPELDLLEEDPGSQEPAPGTFNAVARPLEKEKKEKEKKPVARHPKPRSRANDLLLW